MDKDRPLISAAFITLSGALTMRVNDEDKPLQLRNIQTQFRIGIKKRSLTPFSICHAHLLSGRNIIQVLFACLNNHSNGGLAGGPLRASISFPILHLLHRLK